MSLKISCNFFCASRDYEQERRYSGQILQSSEAQKCLVKGFDNKINVKGNLPCFQWLPKPQELYLPNCIMWEPTKVVKQHFASWNKTSGPGQQYHVKFSHQTFLTQLKILVGSGWSQTKSCYSEFLIERILWPLCLHPCCQQCVENSLGVLQMCNRWPNWVHGSVRGYNL